MLPTMAMGAESTGQSPDASDGVVTEVVEDEQSQAVESCGKDAEAVDAVLVQGDQTEGVEEPSEAQQQVNASYIDQIESGHAKELLLVDLKDSASIEGVEFSNPNSGGLTTQKVWLYTLPLDNEWWNNRIIYPGNGTTECDFYSFTIYSPGWVFISVYNRSADVNWGVFDSNTNELITNPQIQHANDPVVDTVYGYLSAGEYDVLLYCPDGGQSGYYDIRGAYASTINLSQVDFLTLRNQTYSGKAYTPSVDGSYKTTELIPNRDYTLSYQSNKNVGTAKVIIRGKGRYSGTKTLTFDIKPKGTTIKKAKAGKGSVTLSWKKQKKETTGYQIQYSKNSSFSKAKTITVKKSKSSRKITKLERKRTYYARIRTYKKVNGKKYYSVWSKAKKFTTK